MTTRTEIEPTPMKNRTTTERKSDRELVVTRTFNAPARIVFDAWTKPELFAGGYRSRWACPCSPARWMSVSEASTVSCSASMARW